MYTKEFEIRWSDLDANRHVANSTFADLFTETRMAFLRENGFTQKKFAEYGIGPVIFSEDFYYIKEIRPNEIIKVSLELLANTVDLKYVKFEHCLFNSENKLSVYSETFFGWFNLNERKLVVPPDEIKVIFPLLSQSTRYEILPDTISLKNPKIPFGKSW
jgi:acyl-CoA thioester hydrolase